MGRQYKVLAFPHQNGQNGPFRHLTLDDAECRRQARAVNFAPLAGFPGHRKSHFFRNLKVWDASLRADGAEYRWHPLVQNASTFAPPASECWNQDEYLGRHWGMWAGLSIPGGVSDHD
jgi:hypothetical protein